MLRSVQSIVAGMAAALALALPACAGCSLHVWETFALQPDPDRALLKGSVNGHPSVFIVDTGAWASTMPAPDARRLGVSLGGANLTSEGIGGSVPTAEGHMDLRLGDVHLPGEAITVIATHSLDHEAAALIGLDLLTQADLELDLPANRIRLVKVEGCKPADLAYWNPDKPVSVVKLDDNGEVRPAILFNVALNGHLVPAQLDSGSPQTIVDLATARAARGDLRAAAADGEIGGIGAHRIAAETVHFDTFSIGDETIRNAQIVVSELWKYNRRAATGTRLGDEAPEVFRPRMLLGADFLRAHRVLVVNSMRLMAVSYVGGPVFDLSAREPPSSSAAKPPQ